MGTVPVKQSIIDGNPADNAFAQPKMRKVYEPAVASGAHEKLVHFGGCYVAAGGAIGDFAVAYDCSCMC